MSLESKSFGEINPEIENKLDGKIWKSADVSVATGITLQAGVTGDIPVIVPNL